MLSNLRVRHKLAVNSAAFALPLMVAASFLLEVINDDISFSRREVAGVRYIRVANTLAARIGQYRLLAASETDRPVLRSERA